MHRATEMLAVLVGRTESSHIPLGRNLSPGAKTHECALKYIKLDTSEQFQTARSPITVTIHLG